MTARRTVLFVLKLVFLSQLLMLPFQSMTVSDLWNSFRGMSVLGLIVFSFCVGVLLSPWSWGFWWFLVFLVVYEIAWLVYCRWWCQQSLSFGGFIGLPEAMVGSGWSAFSRFGIVVASIAGFLVGRTFSHPTHPLWKTGETKEMS